MKLGGNARYLINIDTNKLQIVIGSPFTFEGYRPKSELLVRG